MDKSSVIKYHQLMIPTLKALESKRLKTERLEYLLKSAKWQPSTDGLFIAFSLYPRRPRHQFF